MTLQELIDQLQALPESARTAVVMMEFIDSTEDLALTDIAVVKYERGEVWLSADDEA